MNNNTLGSITFFRSYAEVLWSLPNHESKGELIDIFTRYAFEGIQPNSKSPYYSLFLALKPNIDNSIKVRTNGSKGGRTPKRGKHNMAMGANLELKDCAAAANGSQFFGALDNCESPLQVASLCAGSNENVESESEDECEDG